MELTAPDDWHHHLRDDAALETTVPFCTRTFRRAICMPNLAPPVTTAALAVAYRERIMAQVPPCKRGKFEALMTLYLTDSTTREAIVGEIHHLLLHCLLPLAEPIQQLALLLERLGHAGHRLVRGPRRHGRSGIGRTRRCTH